jgi:hypothetical protein
MPSESRCQIKILHIFSNWEIANTAGKAAFKSAWKKHEEYGDARWHVDVTSNDAPGAIQTNLVVPNSSNFFFKL